MKKFLVAVFALSCSWFALSENITWRGVPWGSNALTVTSQVGEKETLTTDAENPDVLLIQWGATVTALKFKEGRFCEAFSLIDIPAQTEDWGPICKSIIEDYSGEMKMWPEKPSVDEILAVLRHPQHRNLAWFKQNVHNKWYVLWQDSVGTRLMLTAVYAEGGIIRLRLLMIPKGV